MGYKKDLMIAAEQGDAEAQFNLAVAYYVSLIPRYKKAVYWYEKAAMQGHAKAQEFLASCYFCGTGVKADEDIAISWYITAAKNGSEVAKQFLEVHGVEY